MATTVTLKEYFAAAGSAFTKEDAAVIGPQFEALAETGPIDQRAIVDVAKSANSPLNRFFEWDNEVAGDRYRLIQAGAMMRSIRVRTVEDGRPRVTPAYRLVSKPAVEKPTPRGYNALHDGSALAAKMTTAAYDDLLAWRARYGVYFGAWVDFATAFRQVANQIGEFEDAGRPTGMDAEIDDALAVLLAWRERFGALTPRCEDVAEQMRFMVEAIDGAEATMAATVKPGPRPCLKCSAVFESVGAGNRLCERCSRRAAPSAFAPLAT